MPTSPLDNVVIVEPPFKELTKRHSRLGTACFSGCGCIIIFVIAIFIGIKLYLGPTPHTENRLPANFPALIPIYDEKSIDSITVIPGRYTERGIKLSAVLPHLILHPLYSEDNNEISNEKSLNISPWAMLWDDFSTSSPSAYNTTLRLEWHDLSARPDFIISFYEQALRKGNFQVKETLQQGHNGLIFSTTDQTITGTLTTQKSLNKKKVGTAYARLIVHFPTKDELSSPILDKTTPTSSPTPPTPQKGQFHNL
jgi:hypothetical protein